MDEFAAPEDDAFGPGGPVHFANYVEGIYVGYKYYETAAAEGLIDYDELVQYPFSFNVQEKGRRCPISVFLLSLMGPPVLRLWRRAGPFISDNLWVETL